MRSPRISKVGRGLVRGLFAFCVIASACDKQPTATAADVAVEPDRDDASTPDAEQAPEVVEQPAPPAEFNAPWTTIAPPWKELTAQLDGAVAGKMSGEAWGEDAKVVAVVRAACGSGTLLQTVFETDKGLRVGPAMPLSFFSLATTRPVTYRDSQFEITVDFAEDTPTRLAGKLKITYEEQGKTKTFIDLEVDAKPLPWLLEPRLDGAASLPEFFQCHPSGRFYAKAADGRSTSGFMYAGASPDGRSVVMTPLFLENTGLRIVLLTREPLKEPWTTDLARDNSGAPIQVIVDAVHTPELTSAAEAQGANVGREKTAGVRSGTAEVQWTEKGKSPELEVVFTDLQMPQLIDGPLRGALLTELRIVATAYSSAAYPTPPPAELLGPRTP